MPTNPLLQLYLYAGFLLSVRSFLSATAAEYVVLYREAKSLHLVVSDEVFPLDMGLV